MPVWLVIYQRHSMPNGYSIKNILYCVPTTFEECDKVFDEKFKRLCYNNSYHPYPESEIWIRHDESKFQEKAKDDREVEEKIKDYNDWKEWK